MNTPGNKKKIAFVTGAGSGFGASIAQTLCRQGATAVVADINFENATRVVAEIQATGGCAIAAKVDVTDSRQIVEAVSSTLSHYGRIDILINNAGIGQPSASFFAIEEAEFDKLFAVNVKGLYLTTRCIVPQMIENGAGVIINIASTGALRPRPGQLWYASSKGALLTASKAMALELAPHGIRVNAICPVAGDTPMLSATWGDQGLEETKRLLASSIPLGRLCNPVDIGNAVAFLSSDLASFITGVALEVDGGRCI